MADITERIVDLATATSVTRVDKVPIWDEETGRTQAASVEDLLIQATTANKGAVKLNGVDVLNSLAGADDNAVIRVADIKRIVAALDTKLAKSQLVNNLTSTSATDPLAAAQGKVINDKIANIVTVTPLKLVLGPSVTVSAELPSPIDSYKVISFIIGTRPYRGVSIGASAIKDSPNEQINLPSSFLSQGAFIEISVKHNTTVGAYGRFEITRTNNNASVWIYGV